MPANLRRALTALALAALIVPLAGAGPNVALDEARLIPVQHNGRVKPMEAFARQTLKLVTGRATWEKKPAVAVLLETIADPKKAAAKPWIRIETPALKVKLGLALERGHFSREELDGARKTVEELVRSAQSKRDRDERPSLVEQKAELLYAQMQTVDGLVEGWLLTVVPSSDGHWKSPEDSGEVGKEFLAMAGLFAAGDRAGFRNAAARWNARVVETARLDAWKLDAETVYFRWKPFEWAAALYFAGALLLSLLKPLPFAPGAGLAAVIVAFLFHTAALAIRVAVLGRPPVSNMYESMVYMNWALMLFAFVFFFPGRHTAALTAGSVLSGLVMVYANLLPLDSSLDVLVPVLRSNYWLTIHVMTIVASYGAFGLAMALGHRHLFLWSGGKLKGAAAEASGTLTYRVIQLGVVLIGTGTFLGGVWANESWGRFWGWDPKETWALITFLGYLIVVHLRHLKRLGDFGVAVASILGFLLVLMTWYGVNFVLGRGLHSYGAGTGGMRWVVYYLAFEAAFVGYVLVKMKAGART